MRLLRRAGYRRMPWKNGGGVTEEVAVSPQGSGMDAFDWRLSIAHVEVDGPFSLFPGIDRSIALLEGAGLARMTARALPEMGLISNLVEFPAVGKGLARFRLQVMAGHTDAEISAAADRLHAAMQLAQAQIEAGFDAAEHRMAG